mgnify:CR=1 FL=1
MKHLNPFCEYQIVGKGDARGLKKLAKRYGVEKQVKFCGVYRKEQIAKWLHQMDVYIQPSISEGLDIVFAISIPLHTIHKVLS